MFDGNKALAESPLSPNQERTRDRLERSKKALEHHLADINRALELLDKHPELEEFQDVLKRAVY